jgi:hypothetical protein
MVANGQFTLKCGLMKFFEIMDPAEEKGLLEQSREMLLGISNFRRGKGDVERKAM